MNPIQSNINSDYSNNKYLFITHDEPTFSIDHFNSFKSSSQRKSFGQKKSFLNQKSNSKKRSRNKNVICAGLSTNRNKFNSKLLKTVKQDNIARLSLQKNSILTPHKEIIPNISVEGRKSMQNLARPKNKIIQGDFIKHKSTNFSRNLGRIQSSALKFKDVNYSGYKKPKYDKTPRIDKSIATLSALSEKLLKETKMKIKQPSIEYEQKRSFNGLCQGNSFSNSKQMKSTSILANHYKNNLLPRELVNQQIKGDCVDMTNIPMNMEIIKNLRKGQGLPTKLTKSIHSQSHKSLKGKRTTKSKEKVGKKAKIGQENKPIKCSKIDLSIH